MVVIKKPAVGAIVGKHFKILKQLGEGGFGAVYEVFDRRDKNHCAMKVELEEPAADEPGLDTEGAVLRRLMGYKHILNFIDEGRHDKFRYLAMDLAGTSLSELRRNTKNKAFTNNTTLRCTFQSLEAIEHVHVSGLLHRDIKPANFAIGKSGKDVRVLFLFDFGLVRKYLFNGKVRPPRRSAEFRGSVRYASINCRKNMTWAEWMTFGLGCIRS